MKQEQIDELVALIADGIMQLNTETYGAPGTVNEKQAEERARNIAQAIIGRFELVDVLADPPDDAPDHDTDWSADYMRGLTERIY